MKFSNHGVKLGQAIIYFVKGSYELLGPIKVYNMNDRGKTDHTPQPGLLSKVRPYGSTVGYGYLSFKISELLG
jgi:hypothetical protein